MTPEEYDQAREILIDKGIATKYTSGYEFEVMGVHLGDKPNEHIPDFIIEDAHREHEEYNKQALDEELKAELKEIKALKEELKAMLNK